MNISNVIRKLHEKGISNTDIAQIIEVSKQRVWDVLNPKSKPKLEKNLDGLMTVTEVATSLGIHPNTIRRWANDGKLMAFRIGTRRDRRFRREDVKALLR